MLTIDLQNKSELVSRAAYDTNTRQLFLTFLSGKTTMAYRNVDQEIFRELQRAAYPDVCVRFKIQALHACERMDGLS